MNYVWVLLLGLFVGGWFGLILGYLIAKHPPKDSIVISTTEDLT